MSETRNPKRSGDPVIPDKLYFRIGEVARLLDVETHTLRFWESEFPQLKIGKGGTGQRLYRRRDVELVLEIKHLLYADGYTIPGARQFLQNRSRSANSTKAAPPKPVSTAEEPAATPVSARAPLNVRQQNSEPNLQQIRNELRNLSAMLTEDADKPATSAGPTKPSPRTISPPRRGLHLASRPSENQPSAPRLPSLFDSDSD